MVKFTSKTKSEGRNGLMITTALEIHKTIWNDGQTINLLPVTSKGHIGRCSIEIPTADIPKLIKELNKVLKELRFYNTDLANDFQGAKKLDGLSSWQPAKNETNDGIFLIEVHNTSYTYVTQVARDKDFITLTKHLK